MELPGDSIGISDVIGWRDCPRRFSYQMRRHTGNGTQSDDRTPEAGSWATAYGSAIHAAIHASDTGFDDDAAIQAAWDEWGRYLRPSDLDALREDLAVYHQRDFRNVRTVMNEEEFRVPLLKHDGRQIYFRGKIDRLYERLDALGSFIHVDYKSSRWPKTDAEINEDEQLWAYNFGLYEWMPEINSLLQFYEQLHFGQLHTRKTDDQRRQMGDWLRANVLAILHDDDVQGDGLLRPKKNEWCAWCPILESCPIVLELTEFALIELELLAPTQKVGRKSQPFIEADRIEEYMEALGQAKDAQAILKRFTDAMRDILLKMDEVDRATYGYKLQPRTQTKFTGAGLEQLHEMLGPDFFEVASVTKTALESFFQGDESGLQSAMDLAVQEAGSSAVVRA